MPGVCGLKGSRSSAARGRGGVQNGICRPVRHGLGAISLQSSTPPLDSHFCPPAHRQHRRRAPDAPRRPPYTTSGASQVSRRSGHPRRHESMQLIGAFGIPVRLTQQIVYISLPRPVIIYGLQSVRYRFNLQQRQPSAVCENERRRCKEINAQIKGSKAGRRRISDGLQSDEPAPRRQRCVFLVPVVRVRAV